MSNVAFPTFGAQGTLLPGLRCEAWSPFFDTTVGSASTGAEYRVSERTVGRRYTMAGKVRITPGEHRTLSEFFIARAGKQDSFLFTDPWDGVQRRVRFDDDEFPLQYERGGVFSGSFDLVTVAG